MKQLLILLSILIPGITSTYPCRCYFRSLDEEVAQSDQIFIGSVIKKTVDDRAYYLFSVSETFKGNKDDTVTIKTGFGGPDCGMDFEIGKTYLVFSRHNETDRCRRNSLAEGSRDIGILRYIFRKRLIRELK